MKTLKNGLISVIQLILEFFLGFIDGEAHSKRTEGYSERGKRIFLWSVSSIAVAIFILLFFWRHDFFR
ncbi:hypothetical protein B2K_16410 [Paenibacillus mucilaginosus K02]|uniref:Uncharacterized protein n=1 Tax=Paenibacillus mucilaginosus K02 TaxID=997761 RepID=I0BIT7_9BACL|nr:hypothetical protein B2K_16410 [Paenibacillus mucilaginosus K02]